jgi:hypothetical protein
LLSVQKGYNFEAAVVAGKFAAFEEAANASEDKLGLTPGSNDICYLLNRGTGPYQERY